MLYALALPFPEQSFDAVVCQLGIMFFPDRVAGMRQAGRVLNPNGRFLFSVWRTSLVSKHRGWPSTIGCECEAFKKTHVA